MVPLIYHERSVAVIFSLLFGGWAASEMLLGLRRPIAEAKRQDRGSRGVNTLAGVGGTALYFLFPWWLPATTIGWHPLALFLLGAGLAVFGGGVRWYAITTLGRHFSIQVVTSADQSIIQHGPYTLVRHPSYTGLLLIMLGLGLMMTNWASLLAIFLCWLIALLYRISVEEQALLIASKQAYADYMRCTKRLIPFIY